ncbi:hypothetical protein KRM28CT15_39340 [Krasilnikovia sp. M28-CT-15]
MRSLVPHREFVRVGWEPVEQVEVDGLTGQADLVLEDLPVDETYVSDAAGVLQPRADHGLLRLAHVHPGDHDDRRCTRGVRVLVGPDEEDLVGAPSQQDRDHDQDHPPAHGRQRISQRG